MKRVARKDRIRVAAVIGIACLAVGTSADAARLRLRKPARGFQMRMIPFPVPSGDDREGCEYAVTPNRTPMDVGEFELKATPGTHHFVVWEYLGPDRNPADFWSGIAFVPGCSGLGPQNGATNANLFGMLPSRERFRFPPGVAVRLEPHAIVYPNLHFHNYSEKSVLGQAVFNFIPAPKGTVRHHAQALTVGSFQIAIPPRGTAALTGEWHTPTDLNLVQLSTHQHHRGTRVTVHRVDASGADLGELVVSTNWDHPTVLWYQEALRLPAGEGFRFTCEWSNPDDVAVHFGVTTEDEMCFVTGYFYPDVDDAKVSGPGCVPQGAGLECFVPRLPDS
jgi:copper type II ascorbate-dependent monooxygenase-like protein